MPTPETTTDPTPSTPAPCDHYGCQGWGECQNEAATTPPYSPTGVREIPRMVHTPDNGPLHPCRKHLYAARSLIVPIAYATTTWVIPPDAWEKLTANPELAHDWDTRLTHGPAGTTVVRTLLGMRVRIDDNADAPYLKTDLFCDPEDDNA